MSAIVQRVSGIDTNVVFAKAANFVMATTFTIILSWTYKSVVSPWFSYMAFTYAPPATDVLVVGAMAAIIPSLLLPLKAKRAGDFILWVIYYALYIPAIAMPVLMGNLTHSQILALVGSLAAAFVIICIPRPATARETRPPSLTIKTSLFWVLFATLYAALTIWLVAAYGGHLHLAGVQDVYAQRAAAANLSEGGLVGYASGFLSGAFNPFLMAFGLTRGRKSLAALGAAGQVLVYATAAMKSVLLSVAFVPAFFVLVFRNEPFRLSRIGPAIVIPATVLAYFALDIRPGGEIGLLQLVVSLVYMRTFCMVGVLTSIYTEFFQLHPHTYFSHISILRMFIDYPYSDALGRVIGGYLSPDLPMDANANFLATDGMAGLGFWGIVLAGLFFRFFIALFDGVTQPKDLALASCALVPVLVGVTNSSMFTSLLTGGGVMLALLLYLHGNSVPDEHVPVNAGAGESGSSRPMALEEDPKTNDPRPCSA
ncbi:MAG: hypothetical protein KGJ78_16800 [Alphaproteobacteria bacterium]|nr:hypothetical protein [Alphaproteobacteria bacterium]